MLDWYIAVGKIVKCILDDISVLLTNYKLAINRKLEAMSWIFELALYYSTIHLLDFVSYRI
jgi:hypothetical protein